MGSAERSRLRGAASAGIRRFIRRSGYSCAPVSWFASARGLPMGGGGKKRNRVALPKGRSGIHGGTTWSTAWRRAAGRMVAPATRGNGSALHGRDGTRAAQRPGEPQPQLPRRWAHAATPGRHPSWSAAPLRRDKGTSDHGTSYGRDRSRSAGRTIGPGSSSKHKRRRDVPDRRPASAWPSPSRKPHLSLVRLAS